MKALKFHRAPFVYFCFYFVLGDGPKKLLRFMSNSVQFFVSSTSYTT